MAGLGEGEPTAQERPLPPCEILAVAPIGIAYIDADLRYLYVNELIAHLNGLSPEAHVGRTIRDVIGPDRAPSLEETLRSVLQTGQPVPGLGFVAPRAGERERARYWQATFFAVPDRDGARRIGVVVTEVSSRDRAVWLLEGQLRVLERMAGGAPLSEILAFLCTLIEEQAPGLACSILLLDESGRRLHVAAAPNLPDAFNAAIDGVEIGPSVGSCGTAAYRNQTVIVTDVASDPLWNDHRHLALAHGLRACWSLPIRSAAGSVLGTFAVYCRAPRPPTVLETQLLTATTHVAGLAVAAHRNNEERERLLVSERAARRAAEAASRAKDTFLATISHELRTPLSPILAWAGILRAANLPRALLDKAVETIERNARIEAQLVEDLLDVARIASGTLRIDRRRLDLAAIVQSAIDVIRPAAEAKGIAVALEGVQEPMWVAGDPNRLQQVVWNLAANAIKFTPQGGRVTVGLSRAQDQVAITVADTGEGIDPAFLPHVFEHFRQADASFTRRHGGLGLGLAIVRHLVELHGGTVQVASPGPGRGAVATVRLPTGSESTGEPPVTVNG